MSDITVNFSTNEHARRFRYILGAMSKVTVERTEKAVISHFEIPNLIAFEQRLYNSGLKSCQVVKDLIECLAKHPTARLKYVVEL